jgi:single-strand DNA-binding protein
MLNVVAIIGRLAASPELKTTNSGKSVCSFRIANDSGYKDASGQNQTNWLDVTAWG